MDMYVLVNNGFVVLGPFNWSRKKFETALEEDLEITAQLPDTMVAGVPYTVDENTKIYSVASGVDIPHNPRIEIKNGPFWEFTDTHAVFHYEPAEMDLQHAKSVMNQEVSAERWKKENSGCVVTLAGVEYPFGSDRETRNVFQNALLSAQETLNWKVSTDTWLALSKTDVQAIIEAILAHVQTAFDWEKELSDRINACVERTQLLDIVIVEPVEPRGLFTLPGA